MYAQQRLKEEANSLIGNGNDSDEAKVVMENKDFRDIAKLLLSKTDPINKTENVRIISIF